MTCTLKGLVLHEFSGNELGSCTGSAPGFSQYGAIYRARTAKSLVSQELVE